VFVSTSLFDDQSIAMANTGGIGEAPDPDLRADPCRPAGMAPWSVGPVIRLINGPLLIVATALVSFGALTEALMTGVPVVGNIAIGVIQGSRAKRQLDRVALLSEAPATVVRDASSSASGRAPSSSAISSSPTVVTRSSSTAGSSGPRPPPSTNPPSPAIRARSTSRPTIG